MSCCLQIDECRAPGSAAELASGRASRHSRRSQTAFSLLEVMIASGIFFMTVFAILAMVSSLLRNARSLRRVELDAGMVAAQVCNTNKLSEGTDSGDFGNLYPGYSWETDTYEAETNGLWQVDIVVHRQGVSQPVDLISLYLYRPESQSGFGRSKFR
jgi:Tfp pilus assembly protein PilV